MFKMTDTKILRALPLKRPREDEEVNGHSGWTECFKEACAQEGVTPEAAVDTLKDHYFEIWVDKYDKLMIAAKSA